MSDEKKAKRLEALGLATARAMATKIVCKGGIGISDEAARCIFHGVAQMLVEAIAKPKDDWLKKPNCEGFWWFYGNIEQSLEVYKVLEKDGTFHVLGFEDTLYMDNEWVGAWKYQEEPERP